MKVKEKSTCGCPYHRSNKGCNLDDLKSPFCLSYIENGNEIYERFGINLREGDIRDILTIILLAGTNPYDIKAVGRPEINREFIKNTLIGIDALITTIESFPILHSEEA